ncbi:MAG: SRPBCC domain-containing protein [Chloroflexota bacterium]
MKLSGGIEIGAPADQVWTLIIDPVSLSSCIPGVSHVRQIDERTFEGSITVSVGPVDGDFDFNSTLVRREFPDLEVRLEGIDSVTKSRLEATVVASLTSSDPSHTGLAYLATISVRGRLAILGEMILRATAGLIIAELTRCLQARLEGSGIGVGKTDGP